MFTGVCVVLKKILVFKKTGEYLIGSLLPSGPLPDSSIPLGRFKVVGSCLASEGRHDRLSPGLAGLGSRSSAQSATQPPALRAGEAEVVLGLVQSQDLSLRHQRSALSRIWDLGKEGSGAFGSRMELCVAVIPWAGSFEGTRGWLALFLEYDRRSYFRDFQELGLILSHRVARSCGCRRVVGVLRVTRVGGRE